ncbi:shikimate kinase [Cellvibrio japonicus]|uniref:Shikimate kinase n=1 Tax=Cellvibrio japonicus (strain Ueda107) TaxID=498211 RepID=B3PL35_CELJU|nr:shikimate kinase [Cellvibrio japonicus]ACE84752.1 shikimate kinase [Cellvibrio japonicus Ueda107]QEI12925.1 shikimate kinase [Cellvibrio japonicus]QEI16499.1 shikimate kinase [Cellvibrio japonicus]QEI20077.1 shikimate kinase [Cellvibrio japonicus]
MSECYKNSLILVGMPGAGKSTIGLLLAKHLAKDFVDTDLLIQLRAGKTLDDILREQGYLKLRALEEEVLLATDYPNHVIATGGSAVYSDKGMQHLKQFGPVVFLDVTQAELEQRIHNMETRGIAKHPSQSFSDLFLERRDLYMRYADVIIDGNHKTLDQLADEIIYWEAENYAAMDA